MSTCLLDLAFILLGLSVLYQVFFILASSRILWHQSPSESLKTEKPFAEFASIIVAAHNEAQHLPELLPLLLSQNYAGHYEVIIVNDRSNDGSNEVLADWAKQYAHLRYIQIGQTPPKTNPKKWALMQGIKAAKGEYLLFTDADCRPTSADWLQMMVQGFANGKSLVIGFSPYFSQRGWLNAFIQYETFYTALQYFSFALWGLPYMGVGRNLAYRKSLFLSRGGFGKHQATTGGDDDLLIGSIAQSDNVALCWAKEAQVYSFPKTNWGAWLRQKRRHLSVGKHYKASSKLLLGGLYLSQLLYYLLLIYYLFSLQTLNYQNLWQYLIIIRILLMFCIYSLINRKWKAQVSLLWLLYFDFIFTFYIFIIGALSSITNKISWD